MTMHDVPAAVRPVVTRLGRRLAVGLFLDLWRPWAIGTLLAAGVLALACRLFLPDASPYLSWLWLLPVLSGVPPLAGCVTRAYRPGEVAALADSLSGGHGMLLTLVEQGDRAWTGSPLLARVAHLPMPRWRPWRRLAALLPAFAFFALALLLPQRMPEADARPLADEMAAGLMAAVDALREQYLITPDEERTLAEQIDRIRQSARERMDASAWEAADALRDRLAGSAAAKRDAAAWAQEALARYAAAAAAGLDPASDTAAEALASELSQALEALAEQGLLAQAPDSLQRLAGAGGRLSADPELLRGLAASLAEYLEGLTALEGFGELAASGASRRFDPAEFPLQVADGPDGDGLPGVGSVNRGRADATLTWGDESLPAERFETEALPPGAVRNPDDWAPVITLPGAPVEDAQRSAPSAARTYADEAGAAAWRRTLAPRHLSAVRKYFQP
jgi:hypothetical protein